MSINKGISHELLIFGGEEVKKICFMKRIAKLVLTLILGFIFLTGFADLTCAADDDYVIPCLVAVTRGGSPHHGVVCRCK